MNKVIYSIYGIGGSGREIMPILKKQLMQRGYSQPIYFIDDNTNEKIVNGHPVISYNEFLALSADEKFVSISVADSLIREKLNTKCIEDKLRFFSIYPDNLIFLDDVQYEEGMVVLNNVVLSSNIKIGKQFQINAYSYVAHDSVIGDFVTFGPRVSCNGNVHIEDHAYIGTGAILRQGTADQPLVIGKGAVVGMGAVVTKSVPAGAVVVGNPARVMVK